MKTLLSALVLAVAASSQAVEVNVSLASSVGLTDAVFYYKATAPGLSDQDGAPLGDLSAGTHSADVIVKGDLSQYASYRCSLLATYISAIDGHPGVVVGLNPVSALAATGASFESTFGWSESAIFDAVHGVYSGDYSTLLASINTLKSFSDANLDKFAIGPAGGSLLAFSDGLPVGTFDAAPVPEPAALATLGVGAIGLLRRRKRA